MRSTHFWYTVWKWFCFCAQYTLMICRLESVLFLCSVHISDVPPWTCSVSVHSTRFLLPFWNCCVSVHSTHFWCTDWKVFYFCAQYSFLMDRLESVLFLCTVNISHVPSWKCFFFCAQYTFPMYCLCCSVSVHSTHFWCTVSRVFCFCTQYVFPIYPLENVVFLCTVHISGVPSGKWNEWLGAMIFIFVKVLKIKFQI